MGVNKEGNKGDLKKDLRLLHKELYNKKLIDSKRSTKEMHPNNKGLRVLGPLRNKGRQ